MSNVLTVAGQSYADRILACGAMIAPDHCLHAMIKSVGVFPNAVPAVSHLFSDETRSCNMANPERLGRNEKGRVTAWRGFIPMIWRRTTIARRESHNEFQGVSMNILIVEDNANDRRLMRDTLGHHGWTVIEALDEEEGFDLAIRQQPDIILSNALMPLMNGFQLLRALKADPYLKVVPCLFYSATYPGDLEIKLALSLGAEVFMVKPTEPEELWEKICAIMKAWEARQKIPAHLNLVESEEEYIKGDMTEL
jgi:CheY-like chemotaxis protein